ncbi:Type II secretion system F family protein [Candidatus Magnetomoraceae bacterium gMMP-1]
MPDFICKMTTEDGKIIEKKFSNESEAELRERLEKQGNFILKIQKISSFFKQSSSNKSFKEKDFFAFNQEFSVLLKSGLSIIAALDAIIEEDDKSELNENLKTIRYDISTGSSVSEAFDSSSLFSNLYIASLQAGEKSGDIPLAISRYITYMKKTSAIKQKVISACIYPLILTVVSVFVLLFLLIYVVPAFTGTFAETGTKLPFITIILLKISETLEAYFLFIMISIGLFSGGFVYFKKTETGINYIDRWKLKIMGLGKIYLYYAVSKLVRTLSTVLSGGMTLVDSVRMSSGTLNNRFLQSQLDDVIKNLEQGGGFSESLLKTGSFPKLVVKLVEAGESGGALEEVLIEIANYYESEVDTKLSILTSAIEPVLMVIMGFIIGLIVLAMYMPIFQMAGAIQ